MAGNENEGDLILTIAILNAILLFAKMDLT